MQAHAPVLATLFLSAACSSSTSPGPAAPTATATASLEIPTDRGVVLGHRRDGVREFLGIPYAAPPVGALRWQPPQPATAWSTPRDATRRRDACPQPYEGFARETSEDCLNLNVWIPDGATAALPVLLWIHGGGFYQGSGSDDLYDGASLARSTRAIVVTLNYRLGALGFLSHPALTTATAPRRALPAVGLLDQRAAMQWVQRNIAAFGGDPASVVLDGESAGAWSICSHLAMPASRGLFARAILQSGACSDALYFTAEAANAQGEQLAIKLGCSPTPSGTDVASCLRSKPADEVIAAIPFRRGTLLQPGAWWGPIIDGAELPRAPLSAIAAGDFARVPLILGTARAEGTLHTMSFDQVTPDELTWFISTTFGAHAAAPVISHYAGATPKSILSDVVSHGIFRCNNRRVARAASAHGVPVYLYEWTHALAGPPNVHALGATHGIDLFFLWDFTTSGPGPRIGPSPAERPLVELTRQLWSAFLHTGAPTPSWPRYSSSTDAHFVLDHPSSTGTHLDAATCDFWDSLAR